MVTCCDCNQKMIIGKQNVILFVLAVTFIRVAFKTTTDPTYFIFKDTEFPGVVARPIGEFRSTADYQYQLLRCNVDLLKIIQIGFTFMDENGQTPSPISTWQFNFKFNLT